MIKSAHLTASVSRKGGGLFDAVSRLAQTQTQQGMDTRVFGIWDEFFEADRKAWAPVPVMAFRPGWPGMLGRSPRFRQELATFSPDICHTHGLWLYPSVAVRKHSHAQNRPYFVSPHGMLDPWALANSRWKKSIAYWLFERSHLQGARCFRALCVSEVESIRRLGLKNDVAVIPNGIDLPSLQSGTPPPWANYIEPGAKVLLFLSRIHPKKGLVNLVKAWARPVGSNGVSRPATEWVLAIAGWDQGGHEQILKQLASDSGLGWGDIKTNGNREEGSSRKPCSLLFLGPQFGPAKAACYRDCSAFILPSYSEGVPTVVLEAWANAKPVLMTPECNLPEGFQAGAALKVETTEASIAKGLEELRDMNQSQRLDMGKKGYNLVIERFTWTEVAAKMRTAYLWALGGGAKPEFFVGC